MFPAASVNATGLSLDESCVLPYWTSFHLALSLSQALHTTSLPGSHEGEVRDGSNMVCAFPDTFILPFHSTRSHWGATCGEWPAVEKRPWPRSRQVVWERTVLSEPSRSLCLLGACFPQQLIAQIGSIGVICGSCEGSFRRLGLLGIPPGLILRIMLVLHQLSSFFCGHPQMGVSCFGTPWLRFKGTAKGRSLSLGVPREDMGVSFLRAPLFWWF